MNKAILSGRLTRNPEVRYTTGAEPICVAKYTLAVDRKFKKNDKPDCDFINCVAFGKTGEFSVKYFSKGQRVSVVGRIETGSYEKDGRKVYTTDIIVEEQFFADSKREAAPKVDSLPNNDPDDDLPF